MCDRRQRPETHRMPTPTDHGITSKRSPVRTSRRDDFRCPQGAQDLNPILPIFPDATRRATAPARCKDTPSPVCEIDWHPMRSAATVALFALLPESMRWIFPLFCGLALSGAVAGCTSAAPSSGEDATPLDTSTDVGVEDTADAGPIVPPDASEEVGLDVVDRDPIDPGASLGEACEDDIDCDGGECLDLVPGPGGAICTVRCVGDSDCPRDFDCVLVNDSGADARSYCLPTDLCVDPDGDGHGVGPDCLGRDCDEENPNANGSADEVCDGTDNDCDGVVDNDPRDVGLDCRTGFEGVCDEGRTACASGNLTCEARFEASEETCDNQDNDCDGLVDEGPDGNALTRDCYDGDVAKVGIGTCTMGAQTCSDGGFSACIGQVLPAAELCDDLDNDCDGAPDEGLTFNAYYPDSDGDSFGSATATAVEACAQPAEHVANRLDCDDTLDTIRPGAAEIPGDEIDQNCDGGEFCFEDADQDGYRSPSGAIIISANTSCNDPGEAPASDGEADCNDREATAFPGNSEVCDDLDNDCNGAVDEGAGCYPVGHPCDGPADCATALCEADICVAPITCVEDGSCPQRLLMSSGAARRSSERYQLEVGVPSSAASPIRASERFELHVGPTPHLTDP